MVVWYNIPANIAYEFRYVKANLSSKIASSRQTYNESDADVKQAFSRLAYGNFVKISDLGQTNVQLNFRFYPPQYKMYGETNEVQPSSPYDPVIFSMPVTPVAATKICIIKR